MAHPLKLPAFLCALTITTCTGAAGTNVKGVSASVFHQTVDRSVSPEQNKFKPIGNNDKIPLIIDHGLTVKFTFTDSYQDLEDVRLLVQFPHMEAPDGTHYSSIDRQQATRLINGKRMVIFSYIFEEPWELKPGTWSVQILSGEIPLAAVDIETTDENKVNILPPLAPHFIELVNTDTLNTKDLTWISQKIENSQIHQCIGLTLLYKHNSAVFEQPFRHYFKINKKHTTQTLSEDEVNKAVNVIIQRYRDRHPLEISARIYLHFKDSHQTYLKNNGEVIYLEMMFRAAVFTGAFKFRDSELIALSDYIDRDE